MPRRQIFGYVLLVVAVSFGIRKILQSDLLSHIESDWYSFVGFILIVSLLGAAIWKVLKD